MRYGVLTQHIISYKTGELQVMPVKEKVCKGHSILLLLWKGGNLSELPSQCPTIMPVPRLLAVEEVQTK